MSLISLKRTLVWCYGTVYQESFYDTSPSTQFDFYYRAYGKLNLVGLGKSVMRPISIGGTYRVSVEDCLHVTLLNSSQSKDGSADLRACMEGRTRIMHDAKHPIVAYDGWS